MLSHHKYIHDLEKLRLMCEEYDASFETLSEPCHKLTAYVTAGRYPNNVEIEETDVAYALEEAKKIYELCVQLIPDIKQE